MSTTQEMLDSIPPRKEREEALESLEHFVASPGGRYLNKILRSQFAGNQAALSQGSEGLNTQMHPMHYVLQTEFKKGVLAGLELAIRMPQLLVDEIKTSFKLEAEAAAKEEQQ